MKQFIERQQFNPRQPKHEIMARMQCYKMIGLDLAKLESAIHTVEYRIEIIYHAFDENLRVVQITAEVQ